jgi:hypothetical protein
MRSRITVEYVARIFSSGTGPDFPSLQLKDGINRQTLCHVTARNLLTDHSAANIEDGAKVT